MPAKPPQISTGAASRLETLGAELRQHRKRLGVSATVAAESAGMSRITWYRIEQGNPAVTAGAYMQACAVLGLNLELQLQQTTNEGPQTSGSEGAWIPTRIKLADYPQLQQLAWHVRGANTFALTPREALDIYERHGRHLDTTAMSHQEQNLLTALREVLGSTHGI